MSNEEYAKMIEDWTREQEANPKLNAILAAYYAWCEAVVKWQPAFSEGCFPLPKCLITNCNDLLTGAEELEAAALEQEEAEALAC
jgi:hypothetical protein